MASTTGIAIFLAFWASLYLTDVFLRSNKYTSHWYTSFCNKFGVTVSIGQFRWYTTSLNRLFLRLGSANSRFLRVWFTFGVIFGAVAMVMSVFLLTLMVYNTVRRKPVEKQVLTPVMPGVNLPMSQVTYYLLTLLVCGVLHEFGHAIAAVREQVHVNGFGVFVFAIYPGAFVDMCTEHLMSVSPLRQLRIYCAGVWHNFVMVLIALFMLFIIPWGLSPFYSVGRGVVISNVIEDSPVSGPRGLITGDKIRSISGCSVKDIDSWVNCLSESLKTPSVGYCLTQEKINQHDISISAFPTSAGFTDCCNNSSSTHICFYYYKKDKIVRSHSCLPARVVTDHRPCQLPSDCYLSKSVPSLCVHPSLSNSTKLLRVVRRGRVPLLFLGHPQDLHYSVSLSNFMPKYQFIPINLPFVLETFSKYVISLSGALALLNVVPCYALDGQWILISFVEFSLKSIISSQEIRKSISAFIVLYGTILLFCNIFIAMWTLFL